LLAGTIHGYRAPVCGLRRFSVRNVITLSRAIAIM
jgi:hypothetical protein